MRGIRVLLVDDHPVVRQGLRRMLEWDKGIEVIGEAACGEEALHQTQLLSPDVAVMDIRMPGMGGIEAIRQLKEHYPSTDIIVLTLYGHQYLTSAIEAGASGYLLKDIDQEELIDAVKAVHRGQAALHSSLSRDLFVEFASLARGGNGNKFRLSERELEVIRLVAAGATNKEIAAQLFLSDTTIKRNMRAIFDKLEAKDRAEAVSQAYKKGLI